jgi:hypothetical protein
MSIATFRVMIGAGYNLLAFGCFYSGKYSPLLLCPQDLQSFLLFSFVLAPLALGVLIAITLPERLQMNRLIRYTLFAAVSIVMIHNAFWHFIYGFAAPD